MRFQQFLLFAPALLVAAQQDSSSQSSASSSGQSSNGSGGSGGSSASSTSSSSSSSSMMSSSSGSNSNSGDSDSGLNTDFVVTTTFGPYAEATLVTDDSGNVVGTITGGAGALASTLNDNDGYGTVHSSLPYQTITTNTAKAYQTASQTGGAPAATGAQYVGGLIGAGLAVVGLL